jgi:CrcB protein
MNILLAVALGGAIGAVSRYGFGALALKWLGMGFPWGTLGVNVIGSLLMGMIVGLGALKFDVGPAFKAFLTVGFLGGFTTFSAFSLDVALLIEKHENLLVMLYIVASVGLSIAALFLGLKIMRLSV